VDAAVIIILVVVAIIVIAVVAFIASYNKFARQRNTIEESWRQIDVELQRRHDLIGNLVEVTKAAARFEQQTLTRVVEARSHAMAVRGQGPAAQGDAERSLNGAMAGFFAVAEQYPNLKANQDFLYLQEQMVECEDRIAAGRRFYNGNVRAFNTRFDTFPSSMIANFGKFQKKEYYEVDDPQVRAAPSLKGAFDSLNEPVTPTPPIGMIQQPGAPQQPMPPAAAPPAAQPPAAAPPAAQPPTGRPTGPPAGPPQAGPPPAGPPEGDDITRHMPPPPRPPQA
jgi:LemA protein